MRRPSKWWLSASLALALAGATACQASDPSGPPGTPATGTAGRVDDAASAGGDAPSGDADAPSSVAVDTVYHATFSGLSEERREVIRSAAAWEALWAEIGSTLSPAPETPGVDFSEKQLVVAALGTRPSGGYDVELAGVTSTGGALEVVLREVAPGARCLTTQALTNPVLVIALPLLGAEVDLMAERVVRECP